MASQNRRNENPYSGEYSDIADSSPYGYGGRDVELASWDNSHAGTTNPILDECRDMDRSIDALEHNVEEVRIVQQRILNDAESSASSEANTKLQSLASDIMSLCHQLTDRVRAIKSNPDSRAAMNRAQVDRVDRRLRQAVQVYQQVRSDFYRRTQEQVARQYRIVRPEATEDEVRAAVEDTTPGSQIFSEALLAQSSNRQGRARVALSEVQHRHQALAAMERQMAELAQLFQDMDTLVVQQDDYVKQIETSGADATDNMIKGNAQVSAAIVTARKTRVKKWICLGICVLILAVVVIMILVWYYIIRKKDEAPKGQ
ncbi:hypothetical protein NLG97_g1777 [Lecanicillium saksenae]|uniref:Uncharacterized protein n=1 Tax=Lecanicillium saksenae TaxID=468837 RepID=A0ACC1R2T3_9HYPO|nr:hypothetical protein NLG97_g1777 [Lecanicillium saksenae]